MSSTHPQLLKDLVRLLKEEIQTIVLHPVLEASKKRSVCHEVGDERTLKLRAVAEGLSAAFSSLYPSHPLPGRATNLKCEDRRLRSACPSSADAVQTINDAILAGRPRNRFGLPTSLFNKSLATLREEIDTLCDEAGIKKLTSGTVELASDFFYDVIGFVRNDNERPRNLESFFEAIFGSDGKRDASLSADQTSLRPDIVWGDPAHIIIE